MEKLVEQIKKLATIEFWPKDWVIRLLALFFALLLWYFVVGEDKVDTHLLVPVELVNLPRDMVIANQYKQQLEVTISGPRGLVDGLRRQRVSRTINLSAAEPGTMTIRNDAEALPFPRGIEVLRVQPAHTTLVIDRLVEKELPIEAEISGEPAPGYELAQLQLEPSTISVSGPENLMRGVAVLPTIPVDISGLNSPTLRQVPLLLSQELVDLLGETVVNVLLVIQEKTGEIVLEDLEPALVGGREGYDYTISPETLKARLQTPLSFHRDLAALKQNVVVNLEVGALEAGEHQLHPRLTTAGGIEVVSLEPATIKVTVSKGQ